MKPLYLEGQKGIRVFLDGPALLVRCAGEADRLYPVERLSRVVSHPAVSWEQDALLCLLGKSIPVIFIDDRGTIVARMLGAGGERSSLVQQLEELLGRADGTERYADWCAHNQREQLLALARHYPWLGHLPDPERVHRRLLETVSRQLERQAAIASIEHLRARTLAWTTERLMRLGIGAQTPHLTGGIIDLPTDLAGILQWKILLHWAGLLRRYPAARKAFDDEQQRQRHLTWFYQQLEPTLDETGRRVLARLHLWTATRDCP